MATCTVCKKEMHKAAGCKDGYIVLEDGSRKLRSKNHWNEHRCGDCGAKNGHPHHWGCDIDQCPFCEGQLISCGCPIKYLEIIE